MIALVVVALASPARAECPDPEHLDAIAIIADGNAPGLAAWLDAMSFGSGECSDGTIGMVVTGTSIRVPLGPVCAISGSALQGGFASGTISDAASLAIAGLERTGRDTKVLYVFGQLSRSEEARLRRAADAAGVQMWDPVRVEVLEPLELPSPPLAPTSPKWPALALLGVAALIARRTFRA